MIDEFIEPPKELQLKQYELIPILSPHNGIYGWGVHGGTKLQSHLEKEFGLKDCI